MECLVGIYGYPTALRSVRTSKRLQLVIHIASLLPGLTGQVR